MPVYNGEAFLRPALDAILNQEFSDFELLLINDGSTDSTEKIIKSYTDKRIVYIPQTNSGVAASLNNALPLAKGKYIWRHDADDTSLPDKLATQVKFMEAHPEFALCATQIAFMTEKGKIAKDFVQPKNDYFNQADYIEVNRNQFNPYSPITHATVLIKTEVLKSLGGYRTAFKTAEDVDLWLRLLEQYRAVVLNKCDYFVRLYKASATARLGKRNAFYRHLALDLYDQRQKGEQDFISAGKPIIEPIFEADPVFTPGKKLREDLLNFKFPLYLNAKDYSGALKLATESIKDGWKLSLTWKLLIFPIIGTKAVSFFVKLKKPFK